VSYKEEKGDDKETKEKRKGANVVLCGVAAHNLKKTTMRNIKETESDIARACIIFHKRYEQRTGKPTKTISEFEKITRYFSKLTGAEIEKLIKEDKEEITKE
jgi:hypothetical protein